MEQLNEKIEMLKIHLTTLENAQAFIYKNRDTTFVDNEIDRLIIDTKSEIERLSEIEALNKRLKDLENYKYSYDQSVNTSYVDSYISVVKSQIKKKELDNLKESKYEVYEKGFSEGYEKAMKEIKSNYVGDNTVNIVFDGNKISWRSKLGTQNVCANDPIEFFLKDFKKIVQSFYPESDFEGILGTKDTVSVKYVEGKGLQLICRFTGHKNITYYINETQLPENLVRELKYREHANN